MVKQLAYRLRFDWRQLAGYALLSIGSLGGMMLMLFSTARYGVGLSSDSITYLSVAQNLLAGRGWVEFNGQPLLEFPPFYSIVLALISLSWFDLATVAHYLNSVCFGIVILLATHWLMTHTRSLVLTGIGAGATLLSLPLIEVSAYAWSEPLFIVLTLLCLFQLEQYVVAEKPLALYLAGVCAALAYLTRYAGVTLIMSGVAVILWSHRIALAKRVKRAAIFCCLSLLPITIWFARNYLLSATLTGERASSRVPLIQSMRLAVKIVTTWLLPASLPLILRIALAGSLFILLIGALVLALRSHRGSLITASLRSSSPLGLFVGVYTAFLLLSVTVTALSPIDNRYLSPIYVPLVLISLFAMSRLRLIAPQIFGQPWQQAIVLLGLLLWLIYPAHTISGVIQWYRAEGAGGFHTSQWMNSELIAYLRAHEIRGPVYTNESSAVYSLTGQVFRESPRKYQYESSTPTDDMEMFQNAIESYGSADLVWFQGDWWRVYLYDIPDFVGLYHVEPLITTADGTIYRVTLK